MIDWKRHLRASKMLGTVLMFLGLTIMFVYSMFWLMDRSPVNFLIVFGLLVIGIMYKVAWDDVGRKR